MKLVDRKSEALRDESRLVTKKERRDEGSSSSPREGSEEVDGLEGAILKGAREKPGIGVQELIDFVLDEGVYKANDVADKIMDLADEGLLDLSEPQKFRNFFFYIGSPKLTWFSESIVVTAVSLALVFIPLGLLPTALYEPFLLLRYFFGSVLVLFLPGYALIQALYAKRSGSSSFDDLTRYALSFALSLAIVTLIGLVLGGSVIGLETLPIAVSVGAFVVVLLFIAAKRRYDYYELGRTFG